MTDRIEKIGGSVIQHGPNSQRVYLMKLDPADLPGLHDAIMQRVATHGYGKVFAKIPASALDAFMRHGYREEARIPGYFGGQTDAVFLGYYPEASRATDRNAATVAAVLQTAQAQPAGEVRDPAPRALRQLQPGDIPALAGLYRETFASYPFPIVDPGYLQKTMASHVVYFGVFDNDRLIAAASAETDRAAAAAEMTDFATDTAFRGQGLACALLAAMDDAMARQGIRTGYTIARAVSHGMNITFARGGYRFGGTLVNNTGISGAIESMNVWYRHL